VPLAIAIGVIVALLGFLLFAIAHEPGPGAPDVAIGYERPGTSSTSVCSGPLGPELRDGLRRDQFIAAKRAAYANRCRAGVSRAHRVDTFVEQPERSLSRAVSAEGTSVRNDVLLEKRANG